MKKQDTEIKNIISEMRNFVTKKIIPIVLAAFAMQSCTDELEQVNPNALTDKSFWLNTADLNTGLTSVYSALKDNDVLGMIYEPTRTDIAVPYTLRNRTQHSALSSQTFDLTTREVQDKWDALYVGVFRCNQVIDAYKRLEPNFNSDSEKEAASSSS